MVKQCAFFLFLFFIGSQALAQYHTDDLRSRWMKYSGGRYSPYDYGDAIHFRLEEKDRRDTLLIMGKNFHVFVNNQWLKEGKGEVKFSAESLMQQFPSPMVSVFSPHDKVQTYLQHPLLLDTVESRVIPAQKRFVHLTFLILISIFAIVLNINRTYGVKFLFDLNLYLRDAAIPSRQVSSSLNSIYTLFGALLWGFIISATPTGQWRLSFFGFSSSQSGLFFYWIAASAIVLLAVWLKIALMIFLSWVYRLFGVRGVQVYQLNRLWLLAGMLLCIAWVSYVLVSGSVPIPPFLKYGMLLFFVMGYWFIFLVLVKLKNLKNTFQLFSYFCASEILPFLIFIKVLLF